MKEEERELKKDNGEGDENAKIERQQDGKRDREIKKKK